MILTPNSRGALYMVASMAAFTFNDACVKLVAEELPVMQVVFLRGLLTTGMMVALAWAMGLRSLSIPPGDRALVALRTGAEVAGMVCFLYALTHMPLANLSAVLSALPLTVTIAGAVFLGEPVGWRRISAILVGMVGVLMIIQPGGEGFNIYSVVALVAVCLITAREIFTRRFSEAVPSLAVAVITAAAVCVFGGLAMIPQEWEAVDARAGALVGLASVFIIGGYLLSIMVMRVGEIGFVSPFRFTVLVWALILGWFVFGDWPNELTLAGAGIVVSTGLFTLYRERKLEAEGG